MTLLNNPFVTSGYIAPEYFCDRERETEELLRWLVNEKNVAIISTRRMGKTGLIQHCFHLKEIKENYYTFLIDIYATKTLREFVFQLGKVILATLKPKGQKACRECRNGIWNWAISSRRKRLWMKFFIIWLYLISLVLLLSMSFNRLHNIRKRIRKHCSVPIFSIVLMPALCLPVLSVI